MQQPNKATQKLQLEMMSDTVREFTPQWKQYQTVIAPLVHNYFLELVKSGFSEAQAISIVGAHGFMPPTPKTTGE